MPKTWPYPIKAIIFDNDGLLLNTEDIYADAHKQLTDHKDVFDMFSIVQTGDDVKNGKPDPEIFLRA